MIDSIVTLSVSWAEVWCAQHGGEYEDEYWHEDFLVSCYKPPYAFRDCRNLILHFLSYIIHSLAICQSVECYNYT